MKFVNMILGIVNESLTIISRKEIFAIAAISMTLCLIYRATERVKAYLARRYVKALVARAKSLPKCPKCAGRTVIAIRGSGPRAGTKYRACASRKCSGSVRFVAEKKASRIRSAETSKRRRA